MKSRATVVSVLCFLLLRIIATAQVNPTIMPLVVQEPAMQKVLVNKGIIFKTIHDSTLTLDVYYPAGFKKAAPLPVVIFNNGVGGFDIPQWRVYTDWARLIASHGLVAINHQARPGHTLEDGESLIDYLRGHAQELGIDSDRMGLWSCSGNVNTGMPLAFQSNRRYIRALAVYYGIGWRPETGPTPRQDLEILVVKAGLDYPFLNKGIETFMNMAITTDLHVEFISYPEGQHAFDIFDNTQRSKEIILQTVSFLKEKLSKNHPQPDLQVLTTSRLWNLVVDQDKLDEGLRQWNEAVQMYWGKPNQSPFYNQLINERTLNLIGYQLMNSNRVPGAIRLFEANQGLYPNSGNVYDALADAYEKAGDREKTIQYAKLAIEKINVQPNIPRAYRDAVRKSAQEKIDKLQK